MSQHVWLPWVSRSASPPNLLRLHMQVVVKETVTPEERQAAKEAAAEHAAKAHRASCELGDALSSPNAPPPSIKDALARAGHACMQVTAIRHTVKVLPPYVATRQFPPDCDLCRPCGFLGVFQRDGGVHVDLDMSPADMSPDGVYTNK